MPVFTESELTSIVGALTVAIEQYERDTRLCRESGQHTLATQFEAQRCQALRLIARIKDE